MRKAPHLAWLFQPPGTSVLEGQMSHSAGPVAKAGCVCVCGGDGRRCSHLAWLAKVQTSVRGVCFPLQIILLQQIKSSQRAAAKDKLLPCIRPALPPTPCQHHSASPSHENHTHQQTSIAPPHLPLVLMLFTHSLLFNDACL